MFISDLLTSTPNLTEEVYLTYVSVVNHYVGNIPPSASVHKLQALIEALMGGVTVNLLISNGNVEVRHAIS